jgi:ATP-dependent DNA helicase RecQ
LLNDNQRQNQFTNLRADFYIKTKSLKCVVEIDGAEHTSTVAQDSERDKALEESGVEVFRIPNSEIERDAGPQLERFIAAAEGGADNWTGKLVPAQEFATTTKLAHQIQVATIDAITYGFLDVVASRPMIMLNLNGLALPNAETILAAAVDDLNQLLKNICTLYGQDEFGGLVCSASDSTVRGNCICISYSNFEGGNVPNFLIQNFSFHEPLAYREPPMPPSPIAGVSKENIRYFLEYIFGHPKFNEGQFEAIERALLGKDTIVLLPTGAGKSVAYQLTSMLTPGVMIVVAPIIALINDQIDNLSRAGIGRVMAITSQVGGAERTKVTDAFAQGQFLFCYVSPERFQVREFRNAANLLKQNTPISVIAIDEAHCVSEWGHDFRPAYLNIGRITRAICKTRGFTPPLLALTGTASHAVLRDVQRELQIQEFDAIITPGTFDRAEIEFSLFEADPEDKFSALINVLSRHLPDRLNVSPQSFFDTRGNDTYCGIIFCPWVGGSLGVMKNAEELGTQLGVTVKPYAGKAPKGFNRVAWENTKNRTAREFKANKFPLLCATNSFGMGIDKPDRKSTRLNSSH